MFLAGIQRFKPLGKCFSTVGGYVVVALIRWRVINAEVAETQRTQRKTLKTFEFSALNMNIR